MVRRKLVVALAVLQWLGLPLVISLLGQEMSSSDNKQAMVALFREKARGGELAALLEAHGTTTWELATMGGVLWWESFEEHGWKLQFHRVTGHWRILDASGTRKAWGTRGQLRSLLEDRPTSLLANYFDAGYRFGKTAAPTPSGRTVVLLHGWGVRAQSLQELADALAAEGFDAYGYDYPTAERSLPEHVEQFLPRFRGLLSQLPENEEIYILTHSMGALLLRGALAELEVEEAQRIRAIVMLGPPNQGSALAYLGKVPGVSKINASLKDMTPSLGSYVMSIPAPKWLPPVGIIAGSRDGKVPLKSTHLPDGMAYQHIVVKSTHPGLRKPEKVLPLVLNFFREKKF